MVQIDWLELGSSSKPELFSALEPQKWQLLLAGARRRRLEENYTLFLEGDPPHSVYWILSGQVNIRCAVETGESLLLNRLGAGDLVGVLSLIDAKPRIADAVTAEPTELLVLDRGELLRCIRASPELALCLLALYAERSRKYAERVRRLRQDVLGRVASALLEVNTLRRRDLPASDRLVEMRISQGELAELAGTTRESANRALRRLREVRAIQQSGRRIVVLNDETLRRYCGG